MNKVLLAVALGTTALAVFGLTAFFRTNKILHEFMQDVDNLMKGLERDLEEEANNDNEGEADYEW